MKFDSELCNWIIGTPDWIKRKKTKIEQKEEFDFSTKYLSQQTMSQWTNLFGEQIVKELLLSNNDVVSKPKKMCNLQPDFETETAIYEVKTRNYSTTGTAGEKILGVPYKYRNVPKLYGKPLYIVLVGYQEYEANKLYNLFDSDERGNELLDLYKKFDIYYMKCSDLLKQSKHYLEIVESADIDKFSKLSL